MSTGCEFYKEDFQHSFERRKRGHDYTAPCRYHIILKKNHLFPKYGEIIGDARIPYGQDGCADIALSPFGKVIRNSIENFPKEFPFFQNYQYKVMPDHVHWFINVKERLPKHLGKYISLFKGEIAKNISSFLLRNLASEDIFQPNYTDKIIYPGKNFNVIFNYIRENPHRLAMRIQFPEFFRRVDEIKIGDKIYSSYGNQFLLTNPFKEAIIIHRRYSPQEIEELRKEWLRTAIGGGVLISPFISPSEKTIRDEAEKLGCKFILIQDQPFSEKFKPPKHNFDLCSEGKLLIIAPKEPMKEKSFRNKCIEMNELAEFIAKSF